MDPFEDADREDPDALANAWEAYAEGQERVIAQAEDPDDVLVRIARQLKRISENTADTLREEANE